MHEPTQPDSTPTYAGRAGHKLRAALDAFNLDPAGLRCADFGCNVGGFTDCLLQAGARRVYAVDTGYGQLAWKLRNDPRITVMERTNALRAGPPTPPVDLVVIDLGWTTQRHAVPAALRWLAPEGRIITLVKPHYEASADPRWKPLLSEGALADADAEAVCDHVLRTMPDLGAEVLATCRSPIRGGKSARNLEMLALLRPNTPTIA